MTNKKTLLFLDDDVNRAEYASKYYIDFEVDFCFNAEQAKFLLKNHKYDYISLDHDLLGVPYASSDEKSGYEVAKYICENKITAEFIIIHSYNEIGSKKMLKLLEQNDYDCAYIPFGSMIIKY